MIDSFVDLALEKQLIKKKKRKEKLLMFILIFRIINCPSSFAANG